MNTEIKITITVDIPCEQIMKKVGLWAWDYDIEKAVIEYLKTQGYKSPTLPKETVDRLNIKHVLYWVKKIK